MIFIVNTNPPKLSFIQKLLYSHLLKAMSTYAEVKCGRILTDEIKQEFF